MKIKILVLLLFTLLTSCSVQQVQVSIPKPIPTVPTPVSKPPEPPKVEFKRTQMSIEEKLKFYFRGTYIKPAIVFNNLYIGVRKEREEKIKVSNHTVVWFHSFKETKIKINDDLISLKGKKTLNFVEDKDMEKVDFVNNWDQIKFFNFGDRELIGISMVNDPCTGIGCRVQMTLIYDLKTRTTNFFGTYRFLLDREFGLFDFGNDGKLDFLSGTYIGGSEDISDEFQNIYEIFTMHDTGTFQIQLNKSGKPYFLKRVYREDDYKEIDEKFEHNWIEEIR
jgi:hypothetical protein